MAEIYLSAFNNCVSGLLTNIIFPAIVQGLRNKDITVTVEELSAMTNTPIVKTVTSPAFNNFPGPGHTIPPVTNNFGPNMVPTVGQGTNNNRKNTITTNPIAGRTCMYQFKRGDNKGKYCGKSTSAGCDYCNSCMRSRKIPNAGEISTPGLAPSAGTIPGMVGASNLPPGYDNPVVSVVDENGTTAGKLSVVEYDKENGLFLEPNYKFIVYEISENNIGVIGHLNEELNVINKLTPQQKELATSIGLIVEGESPVNPEPLVAAAPVVPKNVTKVSPIPTINPPPQNTLPVIPGITNNRAIDNLLSGQ